LAYQEITTVNISLDVSAVSRASFGIPLFIADHVWFKEQTRQYSSFSQVADDIPTSSNVYAAMQQAFSQDIDPSVVKVGRREVDSITFTPEAVTAVGQVYTLEVLDTADVTTTATFVTSTGSETATNVTDALITALGSPTGVTVTDNTGSITLAKSGVDAYAVTDVARQTYVTVTTQTAADIMATIVDADNDFYFVACNDHESAFVMALSLDIEAREKQYWVSTQNQADLGVYSESATDIPSLLKQNARFRTSHWFHHEADTLFPEMEYISILAPADAGKKAVSNNIIKSSAAKNPLTGNYLSATNKSNLKDKNSSWTEVVGGIPITRRGSVSGSATFFVDLIRNRHFLDARITEAYQTYQINRPIVPYTDSGIVDLENVLTSVLDRYVETDTQPNILQKNNPYVINFPERKDISFGDVAAQDFAGAFTAYLSGAIQTVKITGSLTYDAQP